VISFTLKTICGTLLIRGANRAKRRFQLKLSRRENGDSQHRRAQPRLSGTDAARLSNVSGV
jgi:hypothetical protein